MAICALTAIVVFLLGFLLFMGESEYFLGQRPMLLTPPTLPLTNPYYEVCGDCLPTDADPNLWEQQCVVKNGQDYPLLYYTMKKTCAKCALKNGYKVCQNYKQPGNIYQGKLVSTFRPSICGNIAK